MADRTDAAPAKLLDKLLLVHVALADEQLTKKDVAVLAILIEAMNRDTGYAFMSVSTLAAVAGIKSPKKESRRRHAQRSLRKLEDGGYIRIAYGGSGPRDTSHYYVRFPQGRRHKSPLAVPKRDTGGPGERHPRPPKPTDTPTTERNTFRTRGAAERGGRNEEQEIARRLRLLEQDGQQRELNDDEIEWLEVIADEYNGSCGDPLGGWAKRLLSKAEP